MKNIAALALISMLAMEGALLATVPWSTFDAAIEALVTATTPARQPAALPSTPVDSESFSALFGKEKMKERWLLKA